MVGTAISGIPGVLCEKENSRDVRWEAAAGFDVTVMIEIRAPIPVSVRLLTLSTRPMSVQDNAVWKRGGPTYRLLQPETIPYCNASYFLRNTPRCRTTGYGAPTSLWVGA